MDYETLKNRQSLNLTEKIYLTQQRIHEWYEAWDGDVSISFSGGKDSTVLLHLIRSLYSEVTAVFVDTGLEYPEIKEFVRTIDNVKWLRPKMPFHKVVEKYGYPVVSKKISMGIDRYFNTKSEYQKTLRLHGGFNPTSGKKQYRTISKKWHYLINAPFKISERCCSIMKKAPLKKHMKTTGLSPFIGMMTGDSVLRKEMYLRKGCNSFSATNPQSNPLSFWTEENVWEYIEKYNLSYSRIYDMGYDHTGCMFCMFGVHLEKGLNRFQRMKQTHPKQWEYCINKLGCGKVLDYIGVGY